MIVIIDNYDSFTYNVFQELSKLTETPVQVFRNNRITVKEIEEMNPESLIISPGPGTPADAGISIEAIKHFAGKIPILGICLGHQAIAESFGGRIVSAQNIVHGKVENISLDGRGLFRNLPVSADFTRYHSLAAERSTLPECLEITAESADGEIMGLRHKDYVIEGVQFHPESIGCIDAGKIILKNFLRYKLEPLDKTALLVKVQKGEDLSRKEAADFMDELTEGSLNPAYTAAVLSALNCKGIAADEIAGCAEVLKRKKVHLETSSDVLDIVGTGGDGHHTFNISSLSALILAASGITVAKHGNRAVSSKSGSADFYREMGIRYNMSPEKSAELLEKEQFAFLFAPLFHKAMAHAAPVRREMGVKTIMNLLGPLVNPAEAAYLLIGVYDNELCPVMARAMKMLGAKRVMTVHSNDGLDEISPAAPTRIFMIDDAGVETDYIFDPKDAGIEGFTLEDLKGGLADENAVIGRSIVEGSGPAAIKAACLLNAGAAMVVTGNAESIIEGYEKAKKVLESGAVKKKLESLIRSSILLEERVD